MKLTIRTLLLTLWAVSCWAQESVHYSRDIRPILSNNCFFCHGFDEGRRQAGLRLDTYEGATRDGAVVPGDPQSSQLIARIFAEDPAQVMPPSSSAYSLTREEKHLIHRWIEQGAHYQPQRRKSGVLSSVWLGTTVACAECHDHKYDPVSSKDYYALSAFFDDLIEIGVYEPGDRRVPIQYIYDRDFFDDQKPPTTSLRAQDDTLSARIDSLRAQLYDEPVQDSALTAWEQKTLQEREAQPKWAEFRWMPAELPAARIHRSRPARFRRHAVGAGGATGSSSRLAQRFPPRTSCRL